MRKISSWEANRGLTQYNSASFSLPGLFTYFQRRNRLQHASVACLSAPLAALLIVLMICNFPVPAGLPREMLFYFFSLGLALCINSHKWLSGHVSAGLSLGHFSKCTGGINKNKYYKIWGDVTCGCRWWMYVSNEEFLTLATNRTTRPNTACNFLYKYSRNLCESYQNLPNLTNPSVKLYPHSHGEWWVQVLWG